MYNFSLVKLPGKKPVLVIGTVPSFQNGFINWFLKVDKVWDTIAIRYPYISALAFYVMAIISWDRGDWAARRHCNNNNLFYYKLLYNSILLMYVYNTYMYKTKDTCCYT